MLIQQIGEAKPTSPVLADRAPTHRPGAGTAATPRDRGQARLQEYAQAAPGATKEQHAAQNKQARVPLPAAALLEQAEVSEHAEGEPETPAGKSLRISDALLSRVLSSKPPIGQTAGHF